MNLNKYMQFRNNEFHEKKHSYLTTPMNSYLSINDKNILRRNTDNSYYQTINNQSSNNNLNHTNQTTNNSYRIHSNTSSITQDVRRHNNVIFNNYNYKTFNKPLNIKKNPISFYKGKNPKQTPLKKYIKISNINKINRNNNNNKNFKTFNSNNIINTSKNQFSNSKNYNSNIYDSEEIDYINMKLNFKLLEQKISHLNNIILPKDVYSSEYQNLSLNNKNIYKNIIPNSFFFDRSAMQKFDTDIYLNENNDQAKFSQYKNFENLKSYILDKKANENSDYIYNLKRRQDKNLINRIHNSNFNIYKEHLAFQKEFEYLNIPQNKNGKENDEIKNNVIENQNELNDIYYNTVDIKNEIIPNKIYTKETYSFNIPSKKYPNRYISMNNNNLNETINTKNFSNNISNLSNNSTSNNKSENYKISNLSEIIYSAENKINNKEKNFRTSDLIIQNVFSYNHHIDDRSKIEKKESINTSKNNEKVDETGKEIVNNDNKEINKNKNDDIKDCNYDDESEKEGERVINSLLAQVTKNSSDKENILMILNKGKNETKSSNNNDNTNLILSPNNKEETDISSNKNNININNKNKKKVTFDDHLIFINYNEKEKVTKFKIIEDKKISQFKPKDISEYLKILTSNTTENKIKPILVNVKKINYNNIVKKKKSNKNKQNQFLKRNIDYIKKVQKKGNNNISKEKAKKNKLKK